MRGEVRGWEARGHGVAVAQKRLAERGRGLQRTGSGGKGDMCVLRTHLKHVAHVSDAGRAETQRLVECLRALPRRKGTMWGRGAACGAGRREGRGAAAAAQAACAGRAPNCGACWRGRRRAHLKHLHHGCDPGRVKAQRLVECRRGLPRRKGSVWQEGRHAGPGDGGGAWAGGGASSVRRGDPTQLQRLCWQGHARSAR